MNASAAFLPPLLAIWALGAWFTFNRTYPYVKEHFPYSHHERPISTFIVSAEACLIWFVWAPPYLIVRTFRRRAQNI